MELENRIREFILTNFYVPDATMVAAEVSLLDRGIIDSTGVLEVITFLESEFGISVGDDEVVPENLDSIARIARFVARKQAERPPTSLAG